MLLSFLYHSLLKSAVGSVEKQHYIRLLLLLLYTGLTVVRNTV